MSYRTTIPLGLLALFVFVSGCELFEPISPESGEPLRVIVISNVDDMGVPDSVRTPYHEDAARLALRQIHAEVDTAEQDVELPADLVDMYYDALVAVYNARDLPARDSVVEQFPVHTFPNPPLHDIIVAVDSTATWAQAWRGGEVRTGHEPIDRIVDAYGLRLKSYHGWSFAQAVVLRSEEPVNTLALCRLFADVAGIRYAEPNGVGGAGWEIDGAVHGDHVRLDYSIGWGDCYAGCISRHHWIFHVYTNGRVAYVGSSGAKVPDAAMDY